MSIFKKVIKYIIHLLKHPNDKIARKKIILYIQHYIKSFLLYKKYKHKFLNILNYCNLYNIHIKYFYTNCVIQLKKPIILNNEKILPQVNDNNYEIKLPDIYLVQLDDVTIFSSTNLIIKNDIVLYEEDLLEDKFYNSTVNSQYSFKDNIIQDLQNDIITIIRPNIKYYNTIKHGIHLLTHYDNNYFHFLIENLTRLISISNINTNVPLIVTSNLCPQLYQALDILNLQSRPIIKLKKNISYRVKKLYYPSNPSIIKDNYSIPIIDRDVAYNYHGILYIRDFIYKKYNLQNTIPYKKIFINRESTYRNIINNIKVAHFLHCIGFEIIQPETLSFQEQVLLFAQSKLIIGQSGAGMANLIFAQKSAKIIMLISNTSQTNLQIFAQLAQIVGVNLEYILGSGLSDKVHTDFYIDIELLKQHI